MTRRGTGRIAAAADDNGEPPSPSGRRQSSYGADTAAAAAKRRGTGGPAADSGQPRTSLRRATARYTADGKEPQTPRRRQTAYTSDAAAAEAEEGRRRRGGDAAAKGEGPDSILDARLVAELGRILRSDGNAHRVVPELLRGTRSGLKVLRGSLHAEGNSPQRRLAEFPRKDSADSTKRDRTLKLLRCAGFNAGFEESLVADPVNTSLSLLHDHQSKGCLNMAQKDFAELEAEIMAGECLIQPWGEDILRSCPIDVMWLTNGEDGTMLAHIGNWVPSSGSLTALCHLPGGKRLAAEVPSVSIQRLLHRDFGGDFVDTVTITGTREEIMQKTSERTEVFTRYSKTVHLARLIPRFKKKKKPSRFAGRASPMLSMEAPKVSTRNDDDCWEPDHSLKGSIPITCDDPDVPSEVVYAMWGQQELVKLYSWLEPDVYRRLHGPEGKEERLHWIACIQKHVCQLSKRPVSSQHVARRRQANYKVHGVL